MKNKTPWSQRLSYPFVKINILRKGKFTEKNQKLRHFTILWQTKY